MKYKFKLLSALFAVSLILFSCSQNNTSPVSTEDFSNSYIVVFNQSGNQIQSNNSDARIIELFAKHNIQMSELKFTYYNVLNGFAANLTKDQVKSLEKDKSINYVEKDQVITLGDEVDIYKRVVTPPTPPSGTNWGVSYVGGPLANTDAGVAWIVDTGIDYTHEGLNVNTSLSATFVTRTKSANDDNGHGTHCAGIVGYENTSDNIIGVCPGVTVIAVKVLNKLGSGTYSQIIAGIDYVAGNLVTGKLNAVNMSFGGGISESLDAAVYSLASNSNVAVCIAAGNSTANANNYSPARVNGNRIYTISAHDSNGAFAYFSNFGNPPIDFSAPGVSIYSCYKNGGYATMSGTSMATPHCVGILLATGGTINYVGFVTADKDSTPDKKAHL